MRYVNLKKRNTSKFHYLAKSTATMSIVRLIITAIIFVPLLSNQRMVETEKANNEVQLINEVDNQVDEVDSIQVSYDIEK